MIYVALFALVTACAPVDNPTSEGQPTASSTLRSSALCLAMSAPQEDCILSCRYCTVDCAEAISSAIIVCAAAAVLPTPWGAAACGAAGLAAIKICNRCARTCSECNRGEGGGGGDDPPEELCPSGHYSYQGFCCTSYAYIPKPNGGFIEICEVDP